MLFHGSHCPVEELADPDVRHRRRSFDVAKAHKARGVAGPLGPLLGGLAVGAGSAGSAAGSTGDASAAP
eukprot:3080453-Alexandrium_andersonii.AAC.1